MAGGGADVAGITVHDKPLDLGGPMYQRVDEVKAGATVAGALRA